MKYTYAAVRLWALLLVLMGPLAARAQAPAWQMAIGANNATVNAVATDASGNVFLTGDFRGTTSFGSTVFTSSVAGADGFIAKWSPVSNGFVWALRLGGIYGETVTAIAVSGTSIYVTGSFRSPSLWLGSSTLTNQGNTSTSSPIYGDMFVAKIADAGTSASFVWAQSAGGNVSDYGSAIAVSGTSVYVAGSFSSAGLGFGTMVLLNGSAAGTPGPYYADMFVAKLTDTGNSGSYVWVQRAGGLGDDDVQSLVVAGTDVYIAGSFGGAAAAFGPVSIANSSNTNGFMARLADGGNAGSFTWAQSSGATISVLATNGTDVYRAGSISRATSFGATTLVPLGSSDVYVAKWSPVSNGYAWAVRAGGASGETATALVANGANVYVVGKFNSPTASFGNTVLTSNHSSPFLRDVFVAKLADAGSSASFDWAQQAGSTGQDEASGVAVGGANVYVVGNISPPVAFGSQIIGGPAGGSAGFLASLAATPLAVATPTLAAGADLFPNPAHGTATVQLPPIPGASTATLTLLDALGRAVRAQTAATNARTVLDLTGLAPGLYALRVSAGGSTATRRLVVE